MALACLGAGLATAIPTAALGLRDVARVPIDAEVRALAVFHLQAVVAALVAYAVSLALRLGGDGPPPALPALLGFALLFLAGGLGAELAGRLRRRVRGHR